MVPDAGSETNGVRSPCFGGRAPRTICAVLERVARHRWLTLFAAARLAATAIALLLLAVHLVTPHDAALALLTLAYGAGSVAAVIRWPRLQRERAWWALDCAIALAFVLGGEEWRSPFYVLALTALILPATTLSFGRALAFGVLFTGAYFAVAVATGVDWSTLDSTARLESFSTHLMVPLLVTASLAYAADLLNRLRAERARAERLALEAERRRIGWELHDSAKQRVHAAHLILSAIGTNGPVRHAIDELEAAVTDMERSLHDLRSPLPAAELADALRLRAAELARAGDVEVTVTGAAPRLAPFVSVHAYRVAAEALTNALRHAGARHVAVRVGREGDRLLVSVADDGRGLPRDLEPGNGMRSMHSRARALDADLHFRTDHAGHGTVVSLSIPHPATEEDEP
jgi:two-component system sensor histidine kinase UhpB